MFFALFCCWFGFVGVFGGARGEGCLGFLISFGLVGVFLIGWLGLFTFILTQRLFHISRSKPFSHFQPHSLKDCLFFICSCAIIHIKFFFLPSICSPDTFISLSFNNLSQKLSLGQKDMKKLREHSECRIHIL